ncbi:polysaccharide biosynthesis protein [Herbidospora sp. NEAU-GS84]|uniref:Polysaccharide biosynthesis protein n=1 Tax=Herbidospora solisilvae TaxID=2696284 RepID=A0A7C9N1H9_9ACTN|nr:polysaccharide biosynthesis C-terminal domain-containing protein [Herbidospora solisilvae]NAS26651.1 polysaccharide biosynthesis protein [Herbidospora solisilvae]
MARLRSVAGLAGAGTSAAAQFAVTLLITRTLPPADAGAFFTTTALGLMLAGVLRLDTGNGLIYFRARGPHEEPFSDLTTARHKVGDRDQHAAVADRTTTISGHRATAQALVAFRRTTGGLPVTSPDKDPSGNSATTAGRPLLAVALVPVVAGALVASVVLTGAEPALALVLPFVVVADVLVAATRGAGGMRETLLLSGLVQPVGQLLLVGGALAAGLSAPWLVVAWGIPAVPVVVLAALRLRGTGTRVSWREFWSHTSPRSLAAALQAVFQRLDVVIVALLAGPAEAAFYVAATRFKVVGQLVGQGLAQGVQAELVRKFAQGEARAARALHRRAARTQMALTWPFWIGYALFAPQILQVFGDGYAHAADVAVVLAVTMMVAAACGMADVVVIASGRTRASLGNVAAALAVTVGLDLLLVPAYGAFGAALGWAGGMLVKNLLPLAQVARATA